MALYGLPLSPSCISLHVRTPHTVDALQDNASALFATLCHIRVRLLNALLRDARIYVYRSIGFRLLLALGSLDAYKALLAFSAFLLPLHISIGTRRFFPTCPYSFLAFTVFDVITISDFSSRFFRVFMHLKKPSAFRKASLLHLLIGSSPKLLRGRCLRNILHSLLSA